MCVSNIKIKTDDKKILHVKTIEHCMIIMWNKTYTQQFYRVK